MYQPGHKRHSLHPYCPHLATSNISPNNKVNANYNGQGSEKGLFASSGGQIWQIDKEVYQTTSSSEWWQERLGGRQSLSPCSIVHLKIQRDDCGRETSRKALLKQWCQTEMVLGLCWERNCWGMKASGSHRGRSAARATRYEPCWNRRIDDIRARNDFWGDDGCIGRLSKWSRRFRRWGGWERWGWLRDRAGQAEGRWRTWQGDGRNPQNGAAVHGEDSSDADEAWWIDTSGMGGCS